MVEQSKSKSNPYSVYFLHFSKIADSFLLLGVTIMLLKNNNLPKLCNDTSLQTSLFNSS